MGKCIIYRRDPIVLPRRKSLETGVWELGTCFKLQTPPHTSPSGFHQIQQLAGGSISAGHGTGHNQQQVSFRHLWIRSKGL
jgi:hypothetical protein